MKYRLSVARSGLRLALACGIALLCACDRGGDGVPQLNPDFIGTDDPNRFLQFLNTQVGLPAGAYTIVAGTRNTGMAGSFTITVTRDDGDVSTFNGGWTSSDGMSAALNGGWTSSDGMSAALNGGNPDFTYVMPYSGGATFEISSSVETCLYLLDPGQQVKAGQYDVGGPNENLCANPEKIDIETPSSKINLAANAEAYYRAIDPPLDQSGAIDLINGTSTRDTLDKWKAANGFGTDCGDGTTTSCEHHVIFRDTKDLGYGRDMYARRNPDGSFAVFVRNFRVNALPGLQYTTLNLNAAISNNVDPTRQNNIQWHFGSNAIEFSTYPYGPGEPRADYALNNLPGGQYATTDGAAPMYAKFYTFRPDDVNDPNTTERRLDLVNLDGRGDKSMPGPCIACHGGMSRPLLPDGTLPAPIPGGIPGDTQSQMQVVEVSTVTFSDVPGWTCEDLREGIHFINQGVLSTYETVQAQYGGVPGYWQPEFGAELIKGWYGDFAGAEDPDDFTIPNASCDYLQNKFYDYVPVGWRPDPNTNMPPPGADDLFREVIAPHCMVCHSRRGVNLGPNQQDGVMQDIDFSSYEKFISHSEQIERFIFHKGVMPLGGLNFDSFWDNPSRAALLASHLDEFGSYESDGQTVLRPGRPYAVIAAPRTTNVPVTLSAEGSSFAESYEWTIVNPVEGAELDGANTARPVFTAPPGSDSTIQLIVRNGSQQSEPVTVNIAVNGSLPKPADLRFDPDIRNILRNPPTDCDSCHSPETSGGVPGVPVFYVDREDLPLEYQNEGRDFYLEVLQRINFKEPIESPLLRKPSNHHHYGGLRSGFDLDGNRSNYDLFLNWILQGAPR